LKEKLGKHVYNMTPILQTERIKRIWRKRRSLCMLTLQRTNCVNTPVKSHPPPKHHHIYWLSQAGPGPAYYPASEYHLYQTREEAPRPRPGPPPLHRVQQQDQCSYAEVVRGQENPVGLSEIKQLLQYICTKHTDTHTPIVLKVYLFNE
jgi:hypothetical protein